MPHKWESTLSEVYSPGFYAAQSEGSFESAKRILTALRAFHTFESVCDFGCGLGTWLAAANDMGVHDILGIDGDYVDRETLRIPKSCFQPHSLSEPVDLGRSFDLAICLEVAEHLSSADACTLTASLTRHADVVLFSAATPYQGGTGHINENWLEFWVRAFASQGFEAVDVLRWQLWHEPGIEWWYRQNCILFRSCVRNPKPFGRLSASSPPSVIHPEQLLRQVRRVKPPKFFTRLDADITYWNGVHLDPPLPSPGYGPEMDWQPPEHLTFKSYADLKSHPKWKLQGVLADAIAPVRLRTQAARPLDTARHAPDFLGIGVQKACSTWLFQNLNRHPATYMAPNKELNFFNRRAFEQAAAWSGFGYADRAAMNARAYFTNAEKINPAWASLLTHMLVPGDTQQWYETIFEHAPDGRIKGEITPEYALLPESGFAEMRTLNPDVKLIVLLRHPVERAVSHLRMIANLAPEARPFLNLIASEHSLLERGRYDNMLDRVFSVFPADQVLIGFEDRIGSDPAAFAAQLAEFLGTDVSGFDQGLLQKKVFEAEQATMLDDNVISELAEAYGETLRYIADRFPEPGRTWRDNPRGLTTR